MTVFVPSEISTETLAASPSIPASDRLTSVDSAAFVTWSSAATETVKASPRSAEVSSVKLSPAVAVLPAASVTAACTASVPSSSADTSASQTLPPTWVAVTPVSS